MSNTRKPQVDEMTNSGMAVDEQGIIYISPDSGVRIFGESLDLEIPWLDGPADCPIPEDVWSDLSAWGLAFVRSYLDDQTESDRAIRQEQWDWELFESDGLVLAGRVKQALGNRYRVILECSVSAPRSEESWELSLDTSPTLLPSLVLYKQHVEVSLPEFCRFIIPDVSTQAGLGAFVFAWAWNVPTGGWFCGKTGPWPLAPGPAPWLMDVGHATPGEALRANAAEADGIIAFMARPGEASARVLAETLHDCDAPLFYFDLSTEDATSETSRLIDWLKGNRIQTPLVTGDPQQEAQCRDQVVDLLLKLRHQYRETFQKTLARRDIARYTEAELSVRMGESYYVVKPGFYPWTIDEGPLNSGVVFSCANPFGSARTDEQNRIALQHLKDQLTFQGDEWVPILENSPEADGAEFEGRAVSRVESEWIFIPGYDASAAERLCIDYRQHAAMVIESGQPTRLLLHPDFDPDWESGE